MEQPTFDSWLLSHYIKDKIDKITHTRIKDVELGIKGGAYKIDTLDEFYTMYLHKINTLQKQEYLTESQMENGPILIDLDFRYKPEVEDRLHTNTHVENFIELLFASLHKLGRSSTPVSVYVMEKATVNCRSAYTKDGIHIIVGLQCPRFVQLLLREEVIRKMDSVFGDLQFTNKYEDVYDISIARGSTNWQLYGSRKPGCKAYTLTSQWVLNENVLSQVEKMDASKLENFKLLTAKYDQHPHFIPTVQDIPKPMRPSIMPRDARSPRAADISRQIATEEDEADCAAVIARLNPERARDFANWNLVYLAIMNNREMSSGMKSRLVHRFSALCPEKYDDGSNVDKHIASWREDSYNDSGYHFASIRMWANEDSPIIPRGVCLLKMDVPEEKPSPAILLDRTRLSESPMADQYTLAQMAEIMGDELSKFIKYSCDAWFVFDSKTCLWTKTKDFPVYMVARFWENICYYNISKITATISATTDDDQRKILIANNKYLRNKVAEFSSPSSNSFIKQCFKSILIDNSFIEKLDMQLGKLVFKDGILDMKTWIFRKGIFYNDFVTNTMDLVYADFIKVPKSDIDKVRTILQEINCNNPAHFNYLMEILGYSMLGYAHKEDVFFTMVGKTAGNGKSTIFETLTAKMPLYCEKLNTKTFEEDNRDTHKMIGACRGKRIVWVNELNKKKLQNTELIKDFADGTFIKNKVLYGTEEKIPIVSKLFFVGNGELKFVTDKGMERRYNYVNFAAKFHDPEEFAKLLIVVPNKDFKKDTQKKEYLKTDNGFYAMLHLILEGTARYLEKGFSIPPEWVEMKKQACEKNDKYHEFISTSLSVSIGECIHKSQFEEVWVNKRCDEEHGKFNWADFQLNMESKGFVFDARKSKKIDGNSKKGCFMDVVFKVEAVD
jgi:phage/plasmid-associated DNA primase